MGLHWRACAWPHSSRTSGETGCDPFCVDVCECDADVRRFPGDSAQQRTVPLSALPIALSCEAIHAVVIGGGAVATRKALALHDAGARIKIIAPAISEPLLNAAASSSTITIEKRGYAGIEDLEESEIVVAATDSADINEAIANDARSLHRLVNVVSDGSKGSFVSMATHRNGKVTIGVTAGGAPKEAKRIRDEIAVRLSEAGSR